MENQPAVERRAPFQAPVVGFILDVAPHPNADRLSVATVDVGKPVSVPVVFGGKRALLPGDTVAVALPGTRLPSGEHIRPRNWRGIKSYGELLSSDELGWTINGPDEVAVLEPAECDIGQSLAPFSVQHALAAFLSYDKETIEYMMCFCRPAGDYSRKKRSRPST
jgi:phenylalanyl-tRNA synthetase beta chain